jgi:hypothetical protein
MLHHSRIASSVMLLATITAAHAEDPVTFHGFVSQGYLLTEGNNYLGQTESPGTLNFNEFAINATATPVDRLRLGVQIFARSIGNYGSDEPEIDWAYANYQISNDLSITVGRFKIPHGLYNETRDVDVSRTEVFLPMSVYSTRLRDVYLAVNGAEVSATLPARMLGSFDASLYVGGQNLSNDGAVAMEYEDNGIQNISSIRLQRMAGAAVTWNTPVDGLRAQGSVFNAHHLETIGSTDGEVVAPGAGPGGSDVLANLDIDSSFQDLWSTILSLEYTHKELTLAAEYTREYGKVSTTSVASEYAAAPTGTPGVTSNVNLGTTTTTLASYRRLEGAYVSAAYQCLPKLTVSAGRGIGFTDYDHRGLSYNRQWTLAARYDILENWLIKAEWDFVEGTQQLFQTENPNATLNRVWQVYAIKTTVDF